MNNIMSRWIQSFSRYGRDSIQLANAVWTNGRRQQQPQQQQGIPFMNRIKPILLDQARQSNSVATSLLNMDKQVGLVKYYGISEFLKRRFQQSTTKLSMSSSSSNSSGSGSGSGSDDSTKKNSGATIAFMVTSSMKEELSKRLGYTPEQIKQMTPLHASLILNNDITPETKEEKLPLILAEYEQQREQEQKKELQRIAAEAAAAAAEEAKSEPVPSTMALSESSSSASSSSGSTGNITHEQSTTSTSSPSYPPPPSTSTTTSSSSIREIESITTYGVSDTPFFSSKNVLDQHDISDFGEIWYEVTETNRKGETTRVGLYSDEKEANLGREVRQEIADRKNIPSIFETHRITKHQL